MSREKPPLMQLIRRRGYTDHVCLPPADWMSEGQTWQCGHGTPGFGCGGRFVWEDGAWREFTDAELHDLITLPYA